MRKAKLSFTSTWPNHVKKRHSISDLKRSMVQNIKADNKQGTLLIVCSNFETASPKTMQILKKMLIFVTPEILSSIATAYRYHLKETELKITIFYQFVSISQK